MGLSLCSFCGFIIIIIFGRRTVLGFDVCHLFPQHMLAIFPLMGVCSCVGVWHVHSPGRHLAPSHGCLGSGGEPGILQGRWGSDLHQLTGPLDVVVASVCACLWGLRWQHQLTPTPGAHAGSTLPPQSTQRKLLWGPALQLECPQQCYLKRAYYCYFKLFIYLSI